MRIKTVGCASIVGTLARVRAFGGHVVALDRASVAEDFGYLLKSSAIDVGGLILHRFAAPGLERFSR